ncbi:MAG: hypothetical protein HRT89_12580 [Lentisphaeria bacterium]|nr:hypothetical protein [Lentisphaeria bacterium]NQZ68893.1 hypothetical protein [Lentisphaeria bacterium]
MVKESSIEQLIKVCIEMLDAIFHIEFDAGPVMNDCPCPEFGHRYLVVLSFSNDNNEGRIILGIPEEFFNVCFNSLEDYLDEGDTSSELRLSAFAELLNVICGDFTGNPKFIETYGHFEMYTPLVFDRHKFNDINLPTEKGSISVLASPESDLYIYLY